MTGHDEASLSEKLTDPTNPIESHIRFRVSANSIGPNPSSQPTSTPLYSYYGASVDVCGYTGFLFFGSRASGYGIFLIRPFVLISKDLGLCASPMLAPAIHTVKYQYCGYS
jgi:hypothetical protein